MPHSAESRLPAILIAWSHYSALCSIARSLKKEIVADSALCNSTWNSIQNFLVDSSLCSIARSQHKYAISQQNRKYFRMIISDLGRLDWWNKPRVENLKRLSLLSGPHLFPHVEMPSRVEPFGGRQSSSPLCWSCVPRGKRSHHFSASFFSTQCCQVLSRLVCHFRKNTPLFGKNTPLIQMFKKFCYFSAIYSYFPHNNFKSKSRIIL
jgi:hypothetical protein